MTLQFGEQVKNEAKKLLEQGKDANQIAKILFDKDAEGYNYGIGIILDGNGKPMTTSATLLEYSIAEMQKSKSGTYMNSATVMAKVKESVLKWQRIPETYWSNFELILPRFVLILLFY